MSCCHHYELIDGHESAFTVDGSRITFGAGCLRELGPRVRRYAGRRVAVFTDEKVGAQPFFADAVKSLRASDLDPVVFASVRVEPTDRSFADAIAFAVDTRPDSYVSIGGGSVIDTAKAANLYATHPASLLEYVNAPVGRGQPVPGPLKPHLACPTTCGTGSECTGIAIFDYLELGAKTGIAAHPLRPTEALIDPQTLQSLPPTVLACSAFDVLSHAAESYTARPYTRRAASTVATRPMSQGANPWSDMGCERALRLLGEFMVRALSDRDDSAARDGLMWAATLAGIAFGNAGVHLPHGMSYAVAGLVSDYYPPDYPPDHAMVPHGMSVIVNAPAVFARTAETAPQRHLDIARWLGADTGQATLADAGPVLVRQLLKLMSLAGFPLGLRQLGYGAGDVGRLTDSAWPQQRLLANAPCEVSRDGLAQLFGQAMAYPL